VRIQHAHCGRDPDGPSARAVVAEARECAQRAPVTLQKILLQ